jgi:serine O-acetyltransferase
LGLWRTLLIAKHSIDISGDMTIGPGLVLPHPVGIALGQTVRIGRDVTILHYVSIGGDVFVGKSFGPWQPRPRLCPAIGDDVVIFTQSILIGAITVGDGAVIGAGAWVDEDVPPKAAHPGRAALFRRIAAK